MTLQGDGRDGASPDAAAKLDLDEADHLAAGFRPAWEVEEEAAPPPPREAEQIPAATQFQGSTGSPSLGPVDPKGATLAFGTRPAMPSAEALDSANVIEVTAAPAFAKTMPLAQPAPGLPPGAYDANRTQAASENRIVAKPASLPPGPAGQARVAQADPFRPAPSSMGSKPPPAARAGSARPAAPARAAPRPASSASTDELDALVPAKRGKGTMFAVAGVAVALGLGLFLKFALSDDPPPTKTNVSSSMNAPGMGPAKTADIPPPPTPEEMPTAPLAKADPKPPEPAPAVAEARPAAQPAAAPRPVEPAPRPTPAREPRPAARPPVAAAPPPAPKPAAEAPKTAPKPPPGGIVRDNPF